MASDPEYGRRKFLKESVSSFARTAHEFVTHRDAPSQPAVPIPTRADWLRPPGAVADALFIERCTRCGDCLKACPYGSIVNHAEDRYPVIFADQAPCRLCADMPCIDACETEALERLASVEAVRMGIAQVSHRDCTASQGCNACLSRCPTGAVVMNFTDLTVEVQRDRCVGCGICEYTCKTVNDRVAIRVVPARQVA
jgi:ferredoxin-type protein NapG